MTEASPQPIVIVNGTRDHEGEAWIGDFSHDEGFWVALRIDEDKVEDFEEAYDNFMRLGISFDITEYADKVVQQGEPGDLWPNHDEFNELKRVYGRGNLKDMDGQNGNNQDHTERLDF
ncbi:MAG: hypothetical protein ACTHOO_10730 [Alcanivorax sp.]